MRKILLCILLTIEIIITGTVYSSSITNELSSNLIRLHILANSDSDYDQNIKLDVRDFLIDNINASNINSKIDCIKSLNYFEDKINEYLFKNKVNYKAYVSYDTKYFTTRNYKDIKLPQGNYECIKIILGEGKGKNWWCVAYPSLCFTKSTLGEISKAEKEKLYDILSGESAKIITEDKLEFKIKFKTIEIFKKMNERLKNMVDK